ncbi:hypothetical protein CYMTET_34870, partial [Cymbomonas tetramitiformis]
MVQSEGSEGEEEPPALQQVPLVPLPCGLLGVHVEHNGVKLVGLLDSGSPVTIVNSAAAAAWGLEMAAQEEGPPKGAPASNPLRRWATNLFNRSDSPASSESFRVAGAGGKLQTLEALKDPVNLTLGDQQAAKRWSGSDQQAAKRWSGSDQQAAKRWIGSDKQAAKRW